MSAHPVGKWVAKVIEVIGVDDDDNDLTILRVSTSQADSMLIYLRDIETALAMGDRLMLEVTPDRVTIEYLGAMQ